MIINSVTNPIYSKLDNSAINVILTLDDGRILPYTAADHDNESHGKKLWAELNAGTHGAIAPYKPKE